MDPAHVGVSTSSLVLGKHSGRHAFRDRVAQLGYALSDEQIESAFVAFKTLADKKKEIFDEDIEALIDTQMDFNEGLWELVGLQVITGSNTIPTATVTIRDSSGTTVQEASVGDGPVDAIFSAIQSITGVKAQLVNYRIQSVSRGKDAQGEVHIEIDHNGRSVKARGISTDILEASARAYINAMNRLRSIDSRQRRQKQAAVS
jgi:2-isopropylmalate synthase